jgi:hypothetical protein
MDAVSRMNEPGILLVAQPPNLNQQIPTKLYDYLCTGNPILVISGEDSATWAAARGFKRCERLDHGDSERNVAVLQRLVGTWRFGELMQERSIGDTESLTKEAVGKEFLCAIETVIQRSAATSF